MARRRIEQRSTLFHQEREDLALRDYQSAMVAETYDLLYGERARSVLVVAATGLGKSVVAAHLARRILPDRTLFLAHRRELVDQAADKMRDVCGHGVVSVDMAESLGDPEARVVCASVQSLALPDRLKRYDRRHFAQVIIDEAHHGIRGNATYKVLLDHFRAPLVGMTATPDRADAITLGKVYTHTLSRCYDMRWGCENGWLVRPVAEEAFVTGYDLSDVRLDVNDLNEDDLSSRLKREKVLAGMADAIIDRAHTKNQWYQGSARPTLVFASSVEHAQLMAQVMNGHHQKKGTGRAAAVYSKSKGMPPMEPEQRRQIIDDFKRGRISFLCSYGVLTEGFDAPNVRMIAMCRPTKSRALYAQMVGRGTRPHPSIVAELGRCSSAAERVALIRASLKPSVLVLDFVGVSDTHSLATVRDILGGEDDTDADHVPQRPRPPAPGERAPQDVLRALQAERQRREEALERARQGMLVKASYTTRPIDVFDLAGARAEREPDWMTGKPATQKQRELLLRLGARRSEVDRLTLHRASKLIDRLLERERQGLCTIGEAEALVRRGYSPDLSRDDAARILTDGSS